MKLDEVAPIQRVLRKLEHRQLKAAKVAIKRRAVPLCAALGAFR